MNSFSALRFSAYAKDLEQAILGMSEDMPPRGWPVRYRTPEQPKPMSDAASNYAANATPLPTVDIVEAKPAQAVVVAEPLKRNITGASGLGASVEKLIAAIKAEVDAAHADLHAAAGEVRGGINSIKSVSGALRGEADDIKSKLGQFSNMGPE